MAHSGSMSASGQHVEGQVPDGVPRVLPLVGHGDDIHVVEMFPVGVATLLALRRRRWAGRIAFKPEFDRIVVELLGPHETGEGLPLHAAFIVAQVRRLDRRCSRRRPRRCAAQRSVSKSRERIVAVLGRLAEPAWSWIGPAGARPGNGPQPWTHCRLDLPDPVAMDDGLVKAVFDVEVLDWACRKGVRCWSRFR